MIKWLKELFHSQINHDHNTEPSLLTIDEVGVRMQRSDDLIERVDWNELEEVGIQTTTSGPYFEDFFLVLHGENGSGCVVSLQQAVITGLVARLQTLPGFDNEVLIQASTNISTKYYVCWQKDL